MKEYIFSTTNCVRCGADLTTFLEWSYHTQGRECYNCGMEIMRYDLHEQHINCLRLIVGDYHIYWHDDFSCRLYNDNSRFHLQGKLMPWLPFDITLEALKVYLTFS